MKLEWSLFAIEDRNKIFDFIEQDDPRAAIFVDEVSKNRLKYSIDSRNAVAKDGLRGHGNW